MGDKEETKVISDVISTVEEILNNIGPDALESVISHLYETNRYMLSDCVYKPQLLKKTLVVVFGGKSEKIIDDLKVRIGNLSPHDVVHQFLAGLEC